MKRFTLQIRLGVSILLFVICLCFSFCTTAAEQPNNRQRGMYLGISAAVTSFDDDGAFSNYDLDDSDSGYRLALGYRIARHCAIELSYADLGAFKVDLGSGYAITEEFSATMLTGYGIVPFGQSGFEFFGHTGYGSIDMKQKLKNFSYMPDGTNDVQGEIVMGIGFRYTPPGFRRISLELGTDIYSFYVEDKSSYHHIEYDQDITYNYLSAKINF